MPFANDHRGNPVHAGKRTEQNANAVSGWRTNDEDLRRGTQYANITEDVAFSREKDPGSEYATQPMEASVTQDSSSGRWTAHVSRPHNFSAYGPDSSWAEGKLAIMNDDVNDRLSYGTPHGDFRTEKRAKIAAEAMINRRNEGRNYKTGRGIIERGPGAFGHPY